MARSKEYERQDVLDAATRLFWEKGFIGTSMSELVRVTGLGKRSMYQEFGNKENMFRECLNNYTQNLNREANSILTGSPQGLASIEAFFENRINYASSCNCNGCMVINTAIEKELVDTGAFDLVRDALSGHEEAFFQCLQAAQKDGDIPRDKDCRALAGFLMTFSAGMMVMCKTEPEKAALRAGVETALSIVKN